VSQLWRFLSRQIRAIPKYYKSEIEKLELEEKIMLLTRENASLKNENAVLKERLGTEATIFRLIGEPYSEYAKAKRGDDENKMVDTLATFLRAVLDLCSKFRAASQCAKEREILRDFVEEQKKIFG